jgi:hypothetical protein
LRFGAPSSELETKQFELYIADPMRMKARLVSFGFSLLFQLQDTRS